MFKRQFLASLLVASQATAFMPPTAPESMKATFVSERLEAIDMPRIRLEGKRNIQLDNVEIFDVAQPKEESFLLTQRFLPDNRMALYVYPSGSIRGGITVGSLNDYMRRLSENAIRRQEFFEVITMPEDEGPTKIRFLGAKPITVEYVVKRIIDGEPQRVKVQDSWAELDGQVYLLRIEAPEDRFDLFFRNAKSLANSMYFLD